MKISHKKVTRKSGKARELASAITERALAHLKKPLDDADSDLAERVQEKLFTKSCGLTVKQIDKLVSHNILARSSTCRVDLLDSSGNEKTLNVTAEDDVEKYFESASWNTFRLEDDALYAEAVALSERWNAFHDNANEMAREIERQVVNRSTKEIIAEWPEAAPIVIEIMGLAGPPPIFKPLEELLAKFLPALPAPKS